MANESVDNGFRQTGGTDNRLFLGGVDVPSGIDGNGLAEIVLNVRITDISTAGSVWVVSPYAGTVVGIQTVIDGAIVTASAVLDPQIGGTSITGGGITIVVSGSAAGIVDTATPSAANTVTANQAIEIATDGGSTNTVSANISVVIRRS